MNILKNNKIDFVNAAVALADDTDDNSSRLDMSGYEGVIFMVTIADCVDTGVATLTAQGNSSDSDSGMTAITGAVATATATANDSHNGKLLIVDVYRPVDRYIQGTLTSATANIAFGETIAIRYGVDKSPVSQSSSTVAASTSVVGS